MRFFPTNASPSIFGLNERAREIVAGAQICEYTEIEFYEPDPRPLYKHTVNGRVYYEALQPNTTGKSRNLFLALQDENGEWLFDSFWTDTEIAEVREIMGEKDPVIAAIESGELQEVQ